MSMAGFCWIRGSRRGVTLIELLVVLVIIGVTTGVAGLAFHSGRTPDVPVTPLAQIAKLRHEAVSSGKEVSTVVVVDNYSRAVTAYPDGRVLVDSFPAVDPLSGRPVAMGTDASR